MESERWQQVEKLFHLALGRETSEREAFLVDACGGDEELRREVDSLVAAAGSDTLSTRLHVGGRVGPYQLEALIGTGGMGEVFRALDTRLHRTVAIKFLLPEWVADASHKRRFLQEARAASALNHPNIVALYDISSQDGRDFLVMEHVQGNPLTRLIDDGDVPVDSVFKLGEQVAAALAAAHGAGIVHRDIKPANIMVTPCEQVKVLDFGIAGMTSRDTPDPNIEAPTLTQFTLPGTVMGTAPYMSPEQARGETLDARSDIFSLGCVLYEAATGRLPFRGSTALAVMHEILTAHPPAPGSLREELPPAFDELIKSCLEKNPARRPESAAHVAKSLRSLLSPETRQRLQAQAGRRSVAVIPFRFRTAQPDDQFLSLALTEAVTNRLAAAPELVVRPIASVLRYAGADVEWTDVARELNVDHVVEGTIQKMGTKVRVLVQAVQVCDSKPLHSAQHDGDMNDLFGLQDRIADSVSGVFLPHARFTAEPAVSPTHNPLAYELYLRAVDRVVHLNKFDLNHAVQLLDRVVEIDPNFADAWGRLAYAYTQIGMHVDPDPQWFEKAEVAIARTLELDPVQCDALCSRANILWSPSRGFQHLPALRALNAALKIDPSRFNVRTYRGAVLFHLGFYEQAKHDTDEAILANPQYAMGVIGLAVIAQYRGEYAQAHEFFNQSTALDPTLVHANIFCPLPLIHMGRFDEAREKIRRGRQIIPDEPQFIGMEALLAADEGNFAQAEQLADEACSGRKSMTHTHHAWHCAAGAYSMCGKPDKAMHQLRQCAKMGLPNYHLFTTDPHLKALWKETEFTELMSDLRREHDQYRLVVEAAI